MSPLPTPLSTAVEGDQEPGVISITDIHDSPHEIPGTINRLAGQMFILTLTQIDCITKLAAILGIGIICIPNLITHIIQPITPIIILVICNII